MHSTFSKIFPWFFGAVFTLIICGWFAIGYFLAQGLSDVDEKGLRGVVEQVWCGKAADCKLPAVR